MQKPGFSPRRCSYFSAFSFLLVLASPSVESLVSAFLLIALLAVLVERGYSCVKLTLLLVLPFSLPLFLIHSLLNPAFPAQEYILGVVPYSACGFLFAAKLSANVGLFTLGVVVWKMVPRDSVFHAFVSWSALPQAILIVLMQSISLINLVGHRASSILLAQQSRGIPVQKNLISKILSIPAIVVPLVAATLIDADQRASALISRGLGTCRMQRKTDFSKLDIADSLILTTLILITLLVSLYKFL